MQPESIEDYTVGIITALSIEFAAVGATLDEEFEDPPDDFYQPASDANTYIWGRIGKHNVVVVSLPAGVYGTVSAATTAQAMSSSIPSIRFGLMVGIGGAIPNIREGRDIRLGDVVISQPGGTSGGVIQYDLGKARSGGFERTGNLAKPPEVLLKAITRLQANHERGKRKTQSILDDMLKRNPDMADEEPGYAHQGVENDQLFEADLDHIPGDTCIGCPVERQITRPARRRVQPIIHYGTIASGSQVIKNASTRDALAASWKKNYMHRSYALRWKLPV